MVLIAECSGTISGILPVLFESSQNISPNHEDRVWFLARTPCFTLGCCLLSRSGRYPRISPYQTGTPWRCQNGCNQTNNATMSGLRLYGLIQTCTNQHHVPPTHSLEDAWSSDFQTLSAGNPSCSCHTIKKELGLSNHLKCERHLVQPSPSAESLGPTSSPAPIAMDPARFLNLQNSKELPNKVSLPALKPKGFKVQEP